MLDASLLRSARSAARILIAAVAPYLALADSVPIGGAGDVARADTVISADPTAEGVSAFGGALVWSRQEAPEGKFRLVQRINGVTRDAPVPVARHPFNADLGPDRSGGIVAVYSRCRERVGVLPVCDVFQLDLGSGRERKLRRVSSRRCYENAPSIWRGLVAYERSGRYGDRRCSRGLYVAGLRRRPILLRKGKRDEGDIRETDIRGHTVAAQVVNDYGSSIITQILLRKFSRRGRSRGCLLRLKVGGGLIGINEYVRAPTLDAGFLYWTRNESTANPYDSEASKVNGFERVRAGCQGGIETASRDRSLLGPAAADRGTLYYTSPRGVLRADGPPPLFGRLTPPSSMSKRLSP